MSHREDQRAWVSAAQDTHPVLVRLAGFAAQRGLVLLSTHWKGRQAAYRLRCARGHEFTRTGAVLERGRVTCLECGRDAIQLRFQDALAREGITCDAEMPALRQLHTFTCGCGHRWQVTADRIIAGSGCPVCRRRRRQQAHRDSRLERLHLAATARGGKCLADVWLGPGASYTWECACGHRWHATGRSIVRGAWCRTCGARRNALVRCLPDGLARLQDKAASHGGQCLSHAFEGTARRYLFRCAQGHEWSATGNAVLRGSWCRRCASMARRDSIGRMQEVARARGGECLSETYPGSRARLAWRCAAGHVWEASAANILHRQSWCPQCARRLSARADSTPAACGGPPGWPR